MLKKMNNVNELEEQHKLDGEVLNKNQLVIHKKELKKEDKIIDPKFIFEKKPKKTKDQPKQNKLRKPIEDSNKKPPPIKEWGY
tara:strand:- start:171 stop:419 length:249 start_codon:yes stop_codon:yes gene_type:complete